MCSGLECRIPGGKRTVSECNETRGSGGEMGHTEDLSQDIQRGSVMLTMVITKAAGTLV